ncbi:MAG: hypothetical protein CMM49_04315 [Rhodospirillaceae bacterium]|nr:hypothetical protein [Rhodospirillaceae bacterium]
MVSQMIKSYIKKILTLRFSREFLCFLAAGYIRFVYHSSSWEFIGFDKPSNYISNRKPFIIAFWHGRLLMLPLVWEKNKILHLLISRHNDGELISKTVKYFGLRSVRGSTKKKGVEAIRKMVKFLKNGEWVGISPDGPHGPRMKASVGIAHVSRLANVPVIPLVYSSNKSKILNTWDKFIIPLPFCKGVFIWGEEISAPKSSSENDIENTRQLIEAELNKISMLADKKCRNYSKINLNE